MLTSKDRPGDIARCDELDVASYLLKPVNRARLAKAIERVSESKQSTDVDTAPRPANVR